MEQNQSAVFNTVSNTLHWPVRPEKRPNMLKVAPWIERKFQFDFPKSLYPNIVERIRGGPARAVDAVKNLPVPVLTRRTGEAWSIQENIGHLLDIEPLMFGRLDDLTNGLPQVRAWEETNRATWEANHNSRQMQSLLTDFRNARTRLVARLDAMEDSLIERSAMHPRLKIPMRVIDLAFFVAEHDDYHLAKVSALKRQYAQPAVSTDSGS